jgi:hypothetical protein
MINEEDIVFFTGAPGSKWSAVYHVMSQSQAFAVDNTDKTPERVFQHGPEYNSVAHTGAYFGPGMEFGEEFDDLSLVTKDYVLEEIGKAFTGEGKKFVKCHQFVHSLDWIAENFPTSKIMIVLRPPQKCLEGWLAVGGIDIGYPNYEPYYMDEKTAQKLLRYECRVARKWIYEKNLNVYCAQTNHFSKYFNTNIDAETDLYLKSLEGYMVNNPDEVDRDLQIRYDCQIAYYNFDEFEL